MGSLLYCPVIQLYMSLRELVGGSHAITHNRHTQWNHHQHTPKCLHMLQRDPMLGSNDPNTIPDPTRIQWSRFCIVPYVSARTPFVFGLRYVLCFLRTPYFPVTFSRDFIDICFMFTFHYSLCFPRAHYVFLFTFSDSAVSPQPYLIVLRLDYSDLKLVSRSGASAL